MCLTIFECHANFTFLTFHFDPWRIGFLFMSESLCRYHHRICTTGPSQRIRPTTSKSMWEPGRSYIILPYHSNPLAYLLISSNVAQRLKDSIGFTPRHRVWRELDCPWHRRACLQLGGCRSNCPHPRPPIANLVTSGNKATSFPWTKWKKHLTSCDLTKKNGFFGQINEQQMNKV